MTEPQPSTSKYNGSDIHSEGSSQGPLMYETFKKRSGTTNKGSEYENLNIANLILNLLKNKNNDSYNISSNHEEYGAFDDIVLENTTPHGIKSTYAIQLKHSDRGNLKTVQLTSPKGNFSIQKYAEDFKNIKNHNSSELHVILFTNLKFDISGDDVVITLDGNENFDIRIKQVTIEQGNLFITADKNGCIYEFEIEENEKTTTRSSIAEKYRIFFQNFKLYTNQQNADELREYIINKFRNHFCCDEIVAKEYLEFISKWSLVENKKEKLNNEMVRCTIANLLFSPFVSNLSFSGAAVDKNTKFLRTAISKFDITLLNEENCGKIKKMWQDLGSNLKNDKETTQMADRYQFLSSLNRDVTKLNDKEKNLLLWLMGKCPIMVPKNTITSKAIELCSQKKIILLGNCDKDEVHHCQALHNLGDLKRKLNEMEYNEILDNFKCSLQGKKEINLRKLINGCDILAECITVNELIEMLNGSFTFGEYEEDLPVPHIERFISKNIIDFKVIDDIMNKEGQNLIVISCFGKLQKNKNIFSNFNIINIEDYLRNPEQKSNNFLMSSSLQKFQGYLKKDIYIGQNECSELEFQQICQKNSNKNCHYLQVTEDEELEWIKTKGDINALIKHRKHEHFVKESDLFNYKSGSTKINIICDDPGMGKSILLKSLKNNYASTFWVILITPTNISTYMKEKKDKEEFVDYIIDKKHKRYASLVRYLNDWNRVTYLWDGLDEVHEKFLKIVYKTIDELSEKGKIQWVTARRHFQSTLEKRFNVFSRRIREFNDKQQSVYIRKRLKGLQSDMRETIPKIENCLKAAKFNDILGIPLQIFMLTELFLQNSEKYEKLFDGIFSLVELFEHFVEEKISIFFKEKVKLDEESAYYETMYEREKKYEVEDCQQLALKKVFEPEILNNLKIELKERNIESSYLKGIVIKVEDESLQFIHNSYGEYFAALYLFERYKSNKLNNLQKHIFKERFRNVRFLFDLMLAKNHPAHIGVLYKNPDIVRKNLQDPAEKDDGGRTCLHLACAWGNTYPLLHYEKRGEVFVIQDDEVFSIEKESSDYCSILEFLTNQNVPDEPDKIFNMRPLDYADKSLCLFPIIKLAERQRIDFKIFENFKDIFRILWYCVRIDYSAVFDVVENTTKIQTQTKTFRESILHLAAEFNAIRFLKAYFKHKKSSNFNDVDAEVNAVRKGGATPLHVACQFGHREIVNELIINKADVNAVLNKSAATPLHVACHNGHREIINELIRNKADVNAACEGIPLQFLFQNEYYKMFDKIDKLINQVNVNAIYKETVFQNIYHEIVDKLKTKVNTVHKDDFIPFETVFQTISHASVDKLNTSINGAEVSAAHKYGFVLLQTFIQNVISHFVDKLIVKRSEVNSARKGGLTALHIAAALGHLEIVDKLITNTAEVNAADKNGTTALYIACAFGHHEVVDKLITNKAEVNAVDKNGFTALYSACAFGHLEIVDKLITNKAEVNAVDKNGFTALYIACAFGHLEVVDKLMTNKAEVNAVSKDGYTPLHFCSMLGHLEIINKLITNKAEVNAANKNGFPALYIACAFGHLEVVDKLIANKAEVNAVVKNGFTALYIACAFGHLEVVDKLMTNKAEVNAVSKDGYTPLHFCSMLGHLEIINKLITNKAEVNAANKDGLTPLHIACALGHLEIVDKLITNKAETNAANKDGLTPLDIALVLGHHEIVKKIHTYK